MDDEATPAPETADTTGKLAGASEEKPQGSGGGWGGWGLSSFSVLSDLQKAAEEISRNAVEAAKSAAKGIADLSVDSDSETETGVDEAVKEKLTEGDGLREMEEESEDDKRRKAALDKLERASEDSLFGQSLKVIDTSVESFASGAWSALSSAIRGGADLVNKLENSAVSLADSIQQNNRPVKATSVAPSIIETGKIFTAKGMEVLERVGKETMELLISETGFDAEKSSHGVSQGGDDDQFEEITFDRCFYIYGGPDQLEELEALSSHHALLFNRKKAKLPAEQKSFYDGTLKQIQQIFKLDSQVELDGEETDKGKTTETFEVENDIEIQKLCDSSVKKASDMALGFASTLSGLTKNDIIQRTTHRLEIVHSEGIHRLSELCCSAISQFLLLGKSIISGSNKGSIDEPIEDTININWPEDSLLKARIIRRKAQSISGDMKTVSNSFITGISDIIEAYLAAMRSASSDAQDGPEENSVQEKANTITNRLKVDGTSAVEKIEDALEYLAYVVLSTSMPTA